jgi:hypothetical protein
LVIASNAEYSVILSLSKVCLGVMAAPTIPCWIGSIKFHILRLVRLRIFYLVLSKVFACDAFVPTRLANPLMPHVNPTFRGLAYVAFCTKLKPVISEPCTNVYLWHHLLFPCRAISALVTVAIAWGADL